MFTLPTGSVPPQSAPSAPAPSPAAAERARRLAITADSTLEMLARVTDAARRLAETATPEVVARRLPPLVRTHAVLTRAIRCINAMEARQEEEATAARTVRAQAEQTRVRARKTLIRRVEDTIAERARPEARENLMREFYERLDDTDLAEDLALEPLQSVFAQTCSDLGLMNGPNHRFRRTPATLAALLARAQLHPRARPTATGPP